jgi:tetratricopeptide (TPR) repeat protein
MRKWAGPALILVVFAGTFALVGGTRSFTDIKLPLFTAAALLVAAWAAWFVALSSVPLASLAPFAASCAAYLVFAAFSAAWAAHPWIVKYVCADRFAMLALAVGAAILLADLGQWRWFAVGYAFLGAAVAAFALWWHGISPVLALLGGSSSRHVPMPELKAFVIRNLHDVKAPLGNANLLAAVLVVSGFLAAGFAVREWRSSRRRGIFIALVLWAILVLPVLYFCKAWSYYLAVAVAAVVFYALMSRRPAFVVSVALIVCAVLSVAAVRSGFVERVRQTRGFIVRDSLWQRATGMFFDRPVFGWGAGNYFTDNQPFAGERALDTVRFYEGGNSNEIPRYKVPAAADAYTHNEYLQELAEGGVAGLAVYLAFLAVPITAALSAVRRGFAEHVLLKAAIAAYSACLVANFFNCEVRFEFGPHFYILAGFLVASYVSTFPAPPRASVSGIGVVAAGLFSVAALVAVNFLPVREYRSSRDYQKAQVLIENKDYSAAVDLHLSAARNTWRPLTRARCLYAAAALLSSTGKDDLAYGTLETTSNEVAAFLDTDLRMGKLLENAGLYEKALFYYRRSMAGHPEYEETRQRLALAQSLATLSAGRVQEGLLQGATASSISPMAAPAVAPSSAAP